MSIIPKGWGEYPPEYNREIHGPYDPAVYYGKRDTPFSQVKLGELTAWLGRRNKSPKAVAGAISRAWWRYQHTWISPKKPRFAFIFQIMAVVAVTGYLMDYSHIKKERAYRYH